MIVFYNPHVDDFLAEPPHFRILKRRPLKKYGYLIQGVMDAEGVATIYVDASISAFIPDLYFSWLPTFIRRWISAYEVRLWTKINEFEKKIRLIRKPSDVAGQTLFAFSYKAATGSFSKRLVNLQAFPTKIFHLSHYFISTQKKADNLQKLDNIWLAGDSDISLNSYFGHFFSWYNRPFVIMPFSVASRFKICKPFLMRQKRCIATGTFHDLHQEVPIEAYRDYINFFDLSTYHPMRKLIHDNAASLEGQLDSKISLYRGKARGGILDRIIKHFSVSQKAYFSINIVELYNSYRYAIVGEEAAGFPALGAFEAMACGCVLIAQPEFYAGLGMVEGMHFIAHDGSLESIVRAIDRLNEDPGAAVAISKAGAEFVERSFSSRQAYQSFSHMLNNRDQVVVS